MDIIELEGDSFLVTSALKNWKIQRIIQDTTRRIASLLECNILKPHCSANSRVREEIGSHYPLPRISSSRFSLEMTKKKEHYGILGLPNWPI